jgi:hypothetical protein
MKCVMITKLNTHRVCDILYPSNDSILRRFITFRSLFDKSCYNVWQELTRDLLACWRIITEHQSRSVLYCSMITSAWHFDSTLYENLQKLNTSIPVTKHFKYCSFYSIQNIVLLFSSFYIWMITEKQKKSIRTIYTILYLADSIV